MLRRYSPPPLIEGRADKGAFYRWLAPIATEINRITGIPASVALGQAWRESKSGTHAGYSVLLTRHNNPLGLKLGTCTAELAIGSVTVDTWEFDPNNRTPGRFAVFGSVYDAVLQRALMFYHPACAGYYAEALQYRTNPRRFLEIIGPRYATDPAYVEGVWGDIETYDLTRYDVDPRAWALDSRYVSAEHIATWQRAVLG